MRQSEASNAPLGELLIEGGLISPTEVDRALDDQRRTGSRLGEILHERGLVSRPSLDRVLAEQSGVSFDTEDGFGAGLRGLIERRHLERLGRRPQDVDSPDVDSPEVPTDHELHALPRRQERRRGDRRTRSDRRRTNDVPDQERRVS
jgi:hypothetical protein